MTLDEYEQQLAKYQRLERQVWYERNRETILERNRQWRKRNFVSRADRRRATAEAVTDLITNGKTRHSVKEMMQVAFEANGGKGDAGARVLG